MADLLLPAAYSAAVTASQVISTTIPITTVQTSVLRSAAVGVACIAALASTKMGADLAAIPAGTAGLSVLSGFIMFFAALAYIAMCRRFGVVETSVATSAFSFVFTVAAGLALGERVTLRTLASIGAIMVAIVLRRTGP